MGGVQHSTLLLAEYLKLKDGVNVEVLLPNPGPLSRLLTEKSVPIKFYNPVEYKSTAISIQNDQLRIPNPFFWIWNMIGIGINTFKIRKNISSNTDLLISKGLVNHFTSVIASKLLKIPIIIHLQDLITDRYYGLFTFIFKQFSKMCSNYIVCDGNMIQQSLGSDLKPKSIVVLNGIKTADFKRDDILRLDIRNEFNISKDAYVIGHIARITSWKGQRQLITAFHEFSQSNKNTYLLLIGSPLFDNDQYYNSIIKLVDELSLRDKVIMPGYRNDLQALFSAMDLFLYPSMNKDTSPLSLLSAISSGLPVGMSNIKSLSEIMDVCPGIDVFNPNNLNEIVNIMDKYKNVDSRDKNGKLNQVSGKNHFDISIHGKKMEQIIQHVYISSK